MGGLSQYLEGPERGRLGRRGRGRAGQGDLRPGQEAQEARDQGRGRRWHGHRPRQVEDITKLPSREALIGRVVSLALAPAQRVVSLANAPAGRPDGPAQDACPKGARAEGEAPRRSRSRGRPPTRLNDPTGVGHRRQPPGRRAGPCTIRSSVPGAIPRSTESRLEPSRQGIRPKGPDDGHRRTDRRSPTTSRPWATRSSS